MLDALIERFRGDAADQKVFSALEKLERAQGLVNDAGESLCSVEGYSEEWSDITSLFHTVKDHWHSVIRRREALQQRDEVSASD